MSGYSQKCLAKLESMGAPCKGWICEQVVTMDDATFSCELCGYDRIRYVHVMVHTDWDGKICVGCVCDGTMSGDMLAAQKRDEDAKRRDNRRKAFLKKQWELQGNNVMVLSKTRNRVITKKDSFRGREFYRVIVNGESYQWWDNRRIETSDMAKTVAFEVLEYERETNRTETCS